MSLISVVIPVCNEQECLKALFDRLLVVEHSENDDYEYIFVDDGSTDASREILREISASHDNVKYLFFSRNFGHEAATTAGIDYARGDAVIIIDADLQHPPDVIPRLVEKWRQGFHVVYARRRSRKGEGIFKRFTSWLFYRIIRMLSEVDIPADTSDFRLMDRRVVRQFRRCREQNRFVRGLVAWTGFKQTAVPYDEDERYAGQTKYNVFRLIILAFDAVLAFSSRPLRLGLLFGIVVCLFSLGIVASVVIQKIFWGIPIPGYAMVAAGIFLLGGVQLSIIGLVGEYVGRIYRQTQQRPLYIVAERTESLPPGPEDLPDDKPHQQADTQT